MGRMGMAGKKKGHGSGLWIVTVPVALRDRDALIAQLSRQVDGTYLAASALEWLQTHSMLPSWATGRIQQVLALDVVVGGRRRRR